MVGIRDEESFNVLAQAYPNLITIAIVANAKLRYSRDCAKHISTPAHTLSMDQFDQRDCLHASWGLLQLIKRANFTLDNSGSLISLKERVGIVVQKIAITVGGSDDQE